MIPKRPRGGASLRSGRGRGKTPRTRDLGGGWYTTYDTVTSLLPLQSAAADLELFYKSIIDSASSRLTTITNLETELAFGFGHYSLRLSSPDPIEWTWIINFAVDMLDTVRSEFATLFHGEAYSYISNSAAVAAVLTSI